MADQPIETSVAAPPQDAAATTNLVSPNGDLVSVDNSQLNAALHPVNGYRLATPEDVANYQRAEKYGTPGQQLQTAGEAALSTATFGLVPGIGKAEDIRGRQEENPVSEAVGSAIPFAAEQFIPGAGPLAAALTAVPRGITKAGEVAKVASGLTGVGAKAVQYAAEGAVMQGQSEVSKMLLKDPESSVPHAIANEGLAAVFAGALGASVGGIGKVSELWAAKHGAKATDAVIESGIKDIASQELQSGIQVPPALRDALAGDQDAYTRLQTLVKSDTRGGKAALNDVAKIYDQAQDKTLEALGADMSHVEKAPNNYEVGSQLVDAIKEGVNAGKQVYGPIYDKLSNKYKNIAVPTDQKATLAADLMQKLSEAGIGALEGSSEKSTMNNLFKSIDSIDTAEGIKNLGTGLNNAAKNPELQRLAAVAGPIIKDFESNVVTGHLANIASGIGPMGEKEAFEAANMLKSRKEADAAYKNAMGIMSDLKTSLGLGRYKGPNGFLRALDEKSPEQVIQRLSATNRQDMITLLQEKFPKAAEILKNYHINDMLHAAKQKDGSGLNTAKFLNTLLDNEKVPGHIQNLVAGQDQMVLDRLGSIKNILNAIPKDGNPSNSAAMLDRLWQGKLGALAGGAMGVGGHGHLLGGLVGSVGENILREISPFLSYKTLEMRGAGKNIVPGNVKAIYDYAKSVAEGHALTNKAVNSIFNHSKTIPDNRTPKDKDRKNLDKYVSDVIKDPTKLTSTASGLQDSMPEHAQALAMTATKAANYLNSIKPRPPLGLPLDTRTKPSEQQVTEYHRQLDIAQQPLMVLQHIKDGTLTSKDLMTLSICAPGMYTEMKKQISGRVMDLDNPVPYKQRLGISLFMGMPMDSTMKPGAIVAAQPMPKPQDQEPQDSNTKPKKISDSAASGLAKMSNMYKTPNQSATERRNKA